MVPYREAQYSIVYYGINNPNNLKTFRYALSIDKKAHNPIHK